MQASRTDFWVALTTALAMLVLRVEIAILLGTGLSLVAFLYRTAHPAMRTMGFDTMAPERRFVVRDDTPGALPECPHIKLLRMEGSIYFGAAAHVADTLHALRTQPEAQKHLLVMAKSMNFIDVAGDAVWLDELRARRAMGGDLYFHRPRPQVMAMWQRTGFLAVLGRDHIYPDKRTAIAAIYARLGPDACAGCPARATWECAACAATRTGT
jgi:SulP family sulfate permease